MDRYSSMPFSFVNLIADVLQLFLLIRFLFIFFGANAANAFVAFVYTATRPFILIFRSIFTPTTVGGYTIDWATLITMIVVAVLATVIMRLLAIILDTAAGDDVDHVHRHA